MLREIQKWHSLVLSGEEEIAKLLHNFIRLEHFCVAVLRNIVQQHSPQVGASFADSWADRADATHIKRAHWVHLLLQEL